MGPGEGDRGVVAEGEAADMNTAVPLDIRNVSYAAAQHTILDSIDWTVSRGEHWVILGPNGSGKTTLLKMACGYLWPNQGGVIYRNGSRRVDLRELRKGIGWVTTSLTAQIPGRERALRTVVSGKFAQVGLLEMSTVRPGEEDYARAEAIMERMGCRRLKDQAFGTLSQGEQQKVLISRALMTRPYLMFLDEPCAGLDPGAREGLLTAPPGTGGAPATPPRWSMSRITSRRSCRPLKRSWSSRAAGSSGRAPPPGSSPKACCRNSTKPRSP